MAFEVHEISSTTRSVVVKVDAEAVEGKRNDIFTLFKQQANLKGFRPGKVPAKIIKKRFASEIEEQLKEDLVRENVQQFFKDTNLEIIGSPQLEDVLLNEDNTFSFTIKLDILPDFELADYRNIKLEKDKVVPDEAAVEEQLLELQKRNAEFHSIVEGRPVQSGDQVLIDFKGSVDLPEPQKSNIEKKMYAESYALEIGSNSFIPGFEDGIIGMTIGAEKDIAITFPKEYQEAALAGQDVTFNVILQDIKEKKLLPIDDEFAKDFGDFKDLAELKQKIGEDMAEYKESMAKNKALHLLREKLIDLNSEFDVPEPILEGQISSAVRRLAYMRKPDDKVDSEAEREKVRPMALREARAEIILDRIALAEKITAEPEDMERKVAELAYQMGKRPTDLMPVLEEKGHIDSIKAEICEEKALNFVYELAEITEVEQDK